MKLKGIDGGPHKQWIMWFNSKQREEPYQGLTSSDRSRDRASLRGRVTGGAWLSSARVVRCLVKSNNERNPYGQLPAFSWALWQDCRGSTRRKEGTTSNHHAPYVLGYTRNTMATTEGSKLARVSKSPNVVPVRTAGCNSPARSRNC